MLLVHGSPGNALGQKISAVFSSLVAQLSLLVQVANVGRPQLAQEKHTDLSR